MKLKCVITLVVGVVSSISTQAYNHGSHVNQEKNEGMCLFGIYCIAPILFSYVLLHIASFYSKNH